jgi:hypothetical protein
MVQRHVGDTGQPQREQRGSRYETTYDPNALAGAMERTETDSPRSHPAVETNAPERKKKTFQRKNYDDLPDTELEKNLDDTGGIDFDLDDWYREYNI